MFNRNFHEMALRAKRKITVHYTSAEKLFLILSSMKLKFSSYENLNDLNESEVNFQISNLHLSATIKDEIVKSCKILSFTIDSFNKNGFLKTWAIDHPRMWAQYADNNKGACIVFDETKLIETNPELKNRKKFRIGNVKYKSWNLENFSSESNDFNEIVTNNYRSIFFTKSLDWKGESERRIFQIGDQEFINIEDSILYICLGFRFDKYPELVEFMINDSIRGKKNLLPYNFVFQSDNYGRIQTYSAETKIIPLAKKNSEYLNFLNDNGYSIK